MLIDQSESVLGSVNQIPVLLQEIIYVKALAARKDVIRESVHVRTVEVHIQSGPAAGGFVCHSDEVLSNVLICA